MIVQKMWKWLSEKLKKAVIWERKDGVIMRKRGGEMFVRKGWNMGEWRRKNNFFVGEWGWSLKLNCTKRLKKKERWKRGCEISKGGKNKNGRKECLSKKISGWKIRNNSQAIQQISSMEESEYPKVYCTSDVWLTVHRNSVWIRKTN